MDRYQKVEKPKPESPINENEIRITTQGAIRNYITYATTLLQVLFFSFFFPLGSNSYSLYYRWVFDENVVTIRYEMFSNCCSLVILLWWSLIDFCNGSVSLADWCFRFFLSFADPFWVLYKCVILNGFCGLLWQHSAEVKMLLFFLNVLKGLSNSASFLEWMCDIVLGNWPFKSVSLRMHVNCLPFV